MGKSLPKELANKGKQALISAALLRKWEGQRKPGSSVLSSCSFPTSSGEDCNSTSSLLVFSVFLPGAGTTENCSLLIF